jgi:hypothetical protein
MHFICGIYENDDINTVYAGSRVDVNRQLVRV